MTTERRQRPLWQGAVFVALGLAILLGLGVWQVQRLKWKEGLLAQVAALQSAAPVPLESVLGRKAAALDFTRVSLDCPGLERAPTLRLYALQDGRPANRLIAACPVAGGSILVDRGFIDADAAPAPGRERLEGPAVGVLRLPSGRNFVTPRNDPAKNLWYWRDTPAMARALGAPRPAPVVLMLESPAPATGTPRPEPVPAEIPNRHLEYALTWFGLAAALAGVYVAMLLRRRAT